MLKILHKNTQMSLDIDDTDFNGDIQHDTALPYIVGLVAGRVVGVNPATGAVALADGAAAGTIYPLGFLINDAAGYFYENKPALASGKVGITHGDCVVITDQIDTTETFAPGDKVYVGTGGEVGLITKTAPTGASIFGIALSAASSASPELMIAVE